MTGTPLYWPYDVLGLTAPATDKRAVKRAYAKRLKQINQATDPQAFQDLRQAYEAALSEVEYDNPPARPALRETSAHFDETQTTAAPTDTSEETGDWARVQELCNQIPNTSITEKNIDRLRRIFNDPVFQDIQAAHMLEQAVFNHVASKLQFVERHAEFAPQISHDILHLIDELFGWYSDSVAFQKRFSVSPEFMAAIASQLGPTGEFEPPPHRFWDWFGKVTVFLGRPWVWVGWAVAIMVLANVLPKPLAATVLGLMILIPIAIFAIIFGGSLLIIVLLPLFRMTKRGYYNFRDHMGWH